MKYIVIVAILSGCASSKYAIVKNDEVKSRISIGNDELVSIRADGKWLWRYMPEHVVFKLYDTAIKEEKIIAEQSQKISTLEAELSVSQSFNKKEKESVIVSSGIPQSITKK